MSVQNGIKANEKPISDDLSYVYAENKEKEFVRVQKEVLKVILGVVTRISELDNDAGFVDRLVADLENYYLKSETYSKDEIDNKLSLIPRFSVQVVTTLPTENISETTVYLLVSEADEDNLYTEYINVNGLWEILGSQRIIQVNVDKTLSIDGDAADAKIVGEKIEQLEEIIDEKLDASKLPEAINTALEQAKESGLFDGQDGKDGYTPIKGVDYFDGQNGKDGSSVTVTNVSESTEDDGSNVVTFSDGKTVTIKNGSKGSDGENGKDGYTPVKGTDYFTTADKNEMVNLVLNSLPTWTGGSY